MKKKIRIQFKKKRRAKMMQTIVQVGGAFIYNKNNHNTTFAKS